MQARRFDYAILALGVCATSTAAIFIREAAAPALIIATYRLVLASAPLLIVSTVRRTPAVSVPNRALLTVVAGVFLALHFAFWVASVQQTSIITSVVLVTAEPLIVALAAQRLLGERAAGATWLGIAIAAAGAAVMVAEDFGEGADTLRGDLYALLGALFAAGYFLTGRVLRAAGEDWLRYAAYAYATAAVILAALAAVSGDAFTGYSERTYLFFVLLALVPQFIGHTALNRSLGYLPAVSVTIAVLGEPVGATILGYVFLDETPSVVELLGGLLVLAGVYAGLRGPSRRHERAAPSTPSP